MHALARKVEFASILLSDSEQQASEAPSRRQDLFGAVRMAP